MLKQTDSIQSIDSGPLSRGFRSNVVPGYEG